MSALTRFRLRPDRGVVEGEQSRQRRLGLPGDGQERARLEFELGRSRTRVAMLEGALRRWFQVDGAAGVYFSSMEQLHDTLCGLETADEDLYRALMDAHLADTDWELPDVVAVLMERAELARRDAQAARVVAADSRVEYVIVKVAER